MKAHFFDLDTILITNAKVWVIDKYNPNKPLMRISKPDFNLIRNGIYKHHGNNIKFNGHNYWFPDSLFNELKIKAKKLDISNLAFSMQEFLNKEVIETLEYDIKLDNIIHLKNTNDDIYVISSKNTKERHELMISKIEEKLKDNGLSIKNFYFISETFYNRNIDDIAHKKVRLLIQHLIGYKTDGDIFIDEELDKYDKIYFYDTDGDSLKLSKDINKLLMFISENTEERIKEEIKDYIKSNEPKLVINEVTGNKVNKFVSTEVKIEFSNLIKVFESFKKLNESKTYLSFNYFKDI